MGFFALPKLPAWIAGGSGCVVAIKSVRRSLVRVLLFLMTGVQSCGCPLVCDVSVGRVQCRSEAFHALEV